MHGNALRNVGRGYIFGPSKHIALGRAYSNLQSTALAVYCGTSSGNRSEYADAAKSLGTALANARYRLVFGGGSKGLGGVVAHAVLDHGGDVTGVLPKVWAGGDDVLKEGPHATIEIVETMGQRKMRMIELAGGFIGLPGGLGTFEEIWQTVSECQKSKPVILLNVLDYYTPFRAIIQTAITAGFLPNHKDTTPPLIFIEPPVVGEIRDFDWGAAAVKAWSEWEKNNSS